MHLLAHTYMHNMYMHMYMCMYHDAANDAAACGARGAPRGLPMPKSGNGAGVSLSTPAIGDLGVVGGVETPSRTVRVDTIY